MAGAEIILAIILVTSLVLAAALGVAWRSFGYPRHALSWALAFAVAAIETGVTAAISLWPTIEIIKQVDLLLTLLAAALVATGARQRAAPGSRERGALMAVPVAWVVLAAAQMSVTLAPYVNALAFVFSSAMFAIATVALKPAERATEPAEWMAIVSIGAFALLEAVLAGLVFMHVARPDAPDLILIAQRLYLIGHPSLSVAAGIAAILLSASDLAVQLRTLAAYDPLTGVLNRRGFQEAALRAIANGRRQRQSIAVAIADIDHFKSINDRYGHTAGDRTLHFISGCLTRGLRGGDVVGRIGGEEFALLLVNSSAEQAAEAMERIRAESPPASRKTARPCPSPPASASRRSCSVGHHPSRSWQRRWIAPTRRSIAPSSKGGTASRSPPDPPLEKPRALPYVRALPWQRSSPPRRRSAWSRSAVRRISSIPSAS
jgi:diguanylate cyclase (GGDEF)-like protein